MTETTRPIMTLFNGALLAIIEEAGVAILTLTEGLEPAEFQRSRLTKGEVKRQLGTLATSAASVTPPMRTAMPEVDWAAWDVFVRTLADNSSTDDELWFAVSSLVPATMMWLQVYRQNQPDLFELTP